MIIQISERKTDREDRGQNEHWKKRDDHPNK